MSDANLFWIVFFLCAAGSYAVALWLIYHVMQQET